MESAAPSLDTVAGRVIHKWHYPKPLLCCRYDPQGRFVFTGSQDNNVERFRLEDGACTVLSGGHLTWVISVTFTKDGSHAITGGCDGRIVWWETAAENPTPVRVVEAHKGWVRELDTSPDGQFIASCGTDNYVRLWNAVDGTLVREFPPHEHHVYTVYFPPQGGILLSGDHAGVIKQWDVASGNEMRTFDASLLSSENAAGQGVRFGGVRAMAVSPDGKWFLAAGLHKATNPLGAVHEPTVLLFNWETQAMERQLIAEGITHGAMERVVWLSDGTIVGVSGGAHAGILVFWKIDTENVYHRLPLLNNARDLDLHPNGLQLATAHHDGHVRITRLTAGPPEAIQ